MNPPTCIRSAPLKNKFHLTAFLYYFNFQRTQFFQGLPTKSLPTQKIKWPFSILIFIHLTDRPKTFHSKIFINQVIKKCLPKVPVNANVRKSPFIEDPLQSAISRHLSTWGCSFFIQFTIFSFQSAPLDFTTDDNLPNLLISESSCEQKMMV